MELRRRFIEAPTTASETILYVRTDKHVKDRLKVQCKRLCVTQAAAVKMALIKFLEEEEKIQAIAAER